MIIRPLSLESRNSARWFLTLHLPLVHHWLSATLDCLVPTVGDQAFPVAAARVWNSLPEHVTSALSVAGFRFRLYRPTSSRSKVYAQNLIISPFLHLISRQLVCTVPVQWHSPSLDTSLIAHVTYSQTLHSFSVFNDAVDRQRKWQTMREKPASAIAKKINVNKTSM